MVMRCTSLLALAGLLLGATDASAAPFAGRVIALRGEVTAQAPGVARRALQRRGEVFEGESVATGLRSTARILLQDGSVLDVGPESELRVQAMKVQKEAQVRTVSVGVTLGRVWARVRRWGGGEFTVTTTNAIAGVRGTSLVVQVDPSGTTVVTVVSGAIELTETANGNASNVGSMQSATVTGDGASIDDVNEQQVQELQSSTNTPPSLDSEGAGELLGSVNEELASEGGGQGQGQGQGQGDEEGEDEGEEDGGDEGDEGLQGDDAPPPERDPGEHMTRVRIRVDVRE